MKNADYEARLMCSYKKPCVDISFEMSFRCLNHLWDLAKYDFASPLELYVGALRYGKLIDWPLIKRAPTARIL